MKMPGLAALRPVSVIIVLRMRLAVIDIALGVVLVFEERPLMSQALTNQILAGLTLLVISVMLIRYGRPARYTMIPMVFVLITSSWAAMIKLVEFYEAGNWLLVAIDVIVVITTFLVILEAASVISKLRREGNT